MIAEAKKKNFVLFMRCSETSITGTTWHTAGLVWRLRPSDVEIQLLGHTHKVLRTIKKIV